MRDYFRSRSTMQLPSAVDDFRQHLLHHNTSFIAFSMNELRMIDWNVFNCHKAQLHASTVQFYRTSRTKSFSFTRSLVCLRDRRRAVVGLGELDDLSSSESSGSAVKSSSACSCVIFPACLMWLGTTLNMDEFRVTVLFPSLAVTINPFFFNHERYWTGRGAQLVALWLLDQDCVSQLDLAPSLTPNFWSS